MTGHQTVALRTNPMGRFLSSWRESIAISLPAVLLVSILFIMPLSFVLWLSVTEPTPGLQNYRMLWESGALGQILERTARLSAITSVFAIIFGYVVAWVLSNCSAKQRKLLIFFILVSFWVSALARAFAWIMLLGTNGPVNNFLTGVGLIDRPINLLYSESGVTIGMIHYMLPYAILPLYAAMKDIDPQLTLAGRGLGGRPGTTFLTVFFPLTIPATLATFTLVFVYSLGFYVTPAVIGGGRVVMVSQYISIAVLETLQWGVASMLSMTLLVSVLLIAFAGQAAKKGLLK